MRTLTARQVLLPWLAEELPAGDDTLRIRLFVSASAWLAIALIIVYALAKPDVHPLQQGLRVLSFALMTWTLWSVNQPRLDLVPARFALAAGCAVIYLQVYDGGASALTWIFLVPLVAVFIFGRTEGSVWIGLNLLLYLAIGVAGVGGVSLELDFAVAYVATGLWALGYESLRRSATEDVERNTANLSAERQRFRDFAEVASDWLFELDGDLKFTFVSDRWAESMQLPASQLIGVPITAVRSSIEREDAAALSEFGATLMEHKPFRDFRFAVRGPGQHIMHIACNGKPLFDDDGNFAGYRGTASDITDFVQSQAEIQSKEVALLQSQKMEAIGQLTSGVAHDFNNLLTVINGNLELLALSLESRGVDTAKIDAATSAATRAAELTAKLLAFARRQPLVPETVRLNGLLEQMLDLLSRTLGEPVSIEVNCEPELWPCRVDPGQLENAILNLAINARDAMPYGGRLSISCRNSSVTGSKLLPDGDYLTLEVRDTGVGITAEALPHVFEPFYSTKPHGQGSGLGLSMVYGFASQSGGAVDIDSAPGQGTGITIWLPRAEPDSARVEPARIAERQPVGPQRVLVVEDEGDVRELVAAMLEAQGHEVRTAADGQHATDILAEWQPELLLTDVVLRGPMTGTRLAELASAKHPGLNVLLMSGYPEYALKGDGSVGVVWQLLKKPFGSVALKAAIEKLYGQHSQHA